jgi:hypothetical protein
MMTLQEIGSCRSLTLNSVIEGQIRRDGERRRNTDAQTDDRSTANVDKKSQIRERRRVDDRIGIWFEDTDKFECCH